MLAGQRSSLRAKRVTVTSKASNRHSRSECHVESALGYVGGGALHSESFWRVGGLMDLEVTGPGLYILLISLTGDIDSQPRFINTFEKNHCPSRRKFGFLVRLAPKSRLLPRTLALLFF